MVKPSESAHGEFCDIGVVYSVDRRAKGLVSGGDALHVGALERFG